MNGIEQTKTLVKINKNRLLYVIVVISLCFSFINIILKNIGLNSIALASLVVLNFLSSTYFAYHLSNNQTHFNLIKFLEYLKHNSLSIGKIAILQFISMVALVMLLKILASNPYTVAFVQVFAIIIYVLLNCINFKLLFSLEENFNVRKCVYLSLNSLRNNVKTLMYLIIKVVTIILLGSIVVYLINVFVYAPQIDNILKTAEVIDSSMLDPFFSSSLSNFIQSFGAQFVSGLCLIWIGVANYRK